MVDLDPLIAAGLLLAGAAAVVLAARALVERRRESSVGALISTDEPGRAGPSLRSERLGLVGRPDELRRSRDGRLVPVEVKSRSSPRGGPPRSHQVQVWVYCLLVEETTGRTPPFGVLRYGDGGEWRVPWDDSARAAVLGLLREIRGAYDGRATPSPAKCAGCRWRPGCDASAA
jgi:CRISPR-associated exonuclease Cas4